MRLLQKRYSIQSPHSFQLVPDRHMGDLGMEAYSHDGYVYQCYVAEDPLSVQQRYEKQRDKLTRDLKKLHDKRVAIKNMLGSVVIRKYIFLIHKFDSRLLLEHAATKATEVVEWGLEFVDPNFAIIVETLENYAAEAGSLNALPPALVEVEDIQSESVSDWAGSNNSLSSTADVKLRKIILTDGLREATMGALLKQYLEGGNALEKLKATSPDAYQNVLKTKAQKEGLLVLEHPPAQSGSNTDLVKIADELQSELQASNVLLGPALAKDLAWATVADWLMRCPLDFGSAS